MNKRKLTKGWKRSLKKNRAPKFLTVEMGERPLCVRVDANLDKIIRSLPDTSDWLRRAIFEQAKHDGLIKVDELNRIIIEEESEETDK